MTYKHLFFDLDQTIAPSREVMLPEMFDLLTSLPHDIIIVTGQGEEVMSWQANNIPAYYLSQCGNAATDVQGNELWRNDLRVDQKAAIHAHVAELRAYHGETENPDWHPLEDRGALICYSPIGNRAPVEVKKAYDPGAKKREVMLSAVPFVHHDDVAVRIGGSTSFDYTHKEQHKGTNVSRLITLMGWNKNDAVYFGDRFGPGGNDEPVLGVIDTVAVDDHMDTYRRLKEMFG